MDIAFLFRGLDCVGSSGADGIDRFLRRRTEIDEKAGCDKSRPSETRAAVYEYASTVAQNLSHARGHFAPCKIELTSRHTAVRYWREFPREARLADGPPKVRNSKACILVLF